MAQHSLKQQLNHSITLFLAHLHDILRPIQSMSQLTDKLTVLHQYFKRINHWIDVANRQRRLQPVKLIKSDEIPGHMIMNNIAHPKDMPSSNGNRSIKNDIIHSQYHPNMDDTIEIYSFVSSKCDFHLFIHRTFGLLKIDTGSLQLDCKVMEYCEKESRNIRNKRGLIEKESYSKTALGKEQTITEFKNQLIQTDESFFTILIEKLELFLSLYTDHTVRVCDYCLRNEIVIERSIEKDYFGAYHKECMKKYKLGNAQF